MAQWNYMGYLHTELLPIMHAVIILLCGCGVSATRDALYIQVIPLLCVGYSEGELYGMKYTLRF